MYEKLIEENLKKIIIKVTTFVVVSVEFFKPGYFDALKKGPEDDREG